MIKEWLHIVYIMTVGIVKIPLFPAISLNSQPQKSWFPHSVYEE